MVNFAVVPERTALINVDMQNCFVSVPNGLVVLERINRLAAVCREAGILVVHTCHILQPDGSDAGVLAEIFPKLDHVHRGSEGAAFHKELVIDPRDILLEKPRFGAFHATNLELLLRARGIDTGDQQQGRNGLQTPLDQPTALNHVALDDAHDTERSCGRPHDLQQPPIQSHRADEAVHDVE